MTATDKIPNGMTLRRCDWYGDDSSAFAGLLPPRLQDDEIYHSEKESPIFLFQSEPYLQGTGLDLHVVQHFVAASVLRLNLPNAESANTTAEEGDGSDGENNSETVQFGTTYESVTNYPIIEPFWKRHPTTIKTIDCGYKMKHHLEDPDAEFCFCCKDVLGFNESCLRNCLRKKVMWPFPAESIRAQKTTSSPIDINCVEDLRANVALIRSNLQIANVLLDKQDIVKHSETVRAELERTYEERVVRIQIRAKKAEKAYDMLRDVGLNKETLNLHLGNIELCITDILSEGQLEKLRAEREAIDLKIASLERAKKNNKE